MTVHKPSPDWSYFGQYLDMEGTAKTEQDLIRRYRDVSIHPECDMPIEDIVNEAIVSNEIDKDQLELTYLIQRFHSGNQKKKLKMNLKKY